MLTTIDNPFDPFTQFDEWRTFDESNGYFTCELLDREAKTSHELSEEDYDLEVERAINEILKYNLSGKHKKVERESGSNVLNKL